MRRRVATIAGALAAVAVACASLDGLEGGTSAPPAPDDAATDAGVDVLQAADVDHPGPSDGGSGEAGSGDASSDAPVMSDVVVIPFCTTVDASFCDDFERTTEIGGWDTVTATDAATLVITDERATSPTRSLHTTVGAGGEKGLACLTKMSLRAYTAARVSFDVFVESVGGPEYVSLGQVFIFDGTDTETIDIRIESSTTTFVTHGTYKPGNPQVTNDLLAPRNLQTGVWEHIQIEYDLRTTPVAKVRFVGGADVAFPLNLVAPQKLGTNLGVISLTPPTQPWKAYYDNFVWETVD